MTYAGKAMLETRKVSLLSALILCALLGSITAMVAATAPAVPDEIAQLESSVDDDQEPGEDWSFATSPEVYKASIPAGWAGASPDQPSLYNSRLRPANFPRAPPSIS